ncbi:hypothetical protein [Piscinibacter sp.]|uniref:hypothetical protein n=1 Tax=Piscinibacter sp. TaxID=1903157 RepID=UPI0039E6351F
MSESRCSVPVRYSDGTMGVATVICTEEVSKDGVEVTMSFDRSFELKAVSERGIFDAVRQIRTQLDREHVLLMCFAADEAVYPSPMQESMGLSSLAYRNRLGRQAMNADIVDIFEADESINPVTVDQQAEFHRRWLESL